MIWGCIKSQYADPFASVDRTQETQLRWMGWVQVSSWLTIEQGVQVEHAGFAAGLLLIHARMADNEQAPVQSVMDGDDEKVLGKNVHPLHTIY